MHQCQYQTPPLSKRQNSMLLHYTYLYHNKNLQVFFLQHHHIPSVFSQIILQSLQEKYSIVQEPTLVLKMSRFGISKKGSVFVCSFISFICSVSNTEFRMKNPFLSSNSKFSSNSLSTLWTLMPL